MINCWADYLHGITRYWMRIISWEKGRKRKFKLIRQKDREKNSDQVWISPLIARNRRILKSISFSHMSVSDGSVERAKSEDKR